MTYEEILGVITGGATLNASDSSGTGGTGVEDIATGTDALDPSKIHDNSKEGAGEGAVEGGDGGEGYEKFEGGEEGGDESGGESGGDEGGGEESGGEDWGEE